MKSLQMVAEIGINHNGSLENAIEMIQLAQMVGFDYVKFQKRNPDVCVPEEQKNKEKRVPWREKPTTYLQYKHDIEFDEEYITIDKLCRQIGMRWFASVWDIDSAREMLEYGSELVKIPSACIVDNELLKFCRYYYDHVILSTGMSTQKEIDFAIEIGKPDVVMHTNCVYPTPLSEVHLGYLLYLKKKFPLLNVGYSNHCPDPIALYMAALYPIDWMEIHVTTDITKWGSDQAASFEFHKLKPIIDNIHRLREYSEKMFQGNVDREVYQNEEQKRDMLRSVHNACEFVEE